MVKKRRCLSRCWAVQGPHRTLRYIRSMIWLSVRPMAAILYAIRPCCLVSIGNTVKHNDSMRPRSYSPPKVRRPAASIVRWGLILGRESKDETPFWRDGDLNR